MGGQPSIHRQPTPCPCSASSSAPSGGPIWNRVSVDALVSAGRGEARGLDQIGAARSADGRLAVVYIPSQRPIAGRDRCTRGTGGRGDVVRSRQRAAGSRGHARDRRSGGPRPRRIPRTPSCSWRRPPTARPPSDRRLASVQDRGRAGATEFEPSVTKSPPRRMPAKSNPSPSPGPCSERLNTMPAGSRRRGRRMMTFRRVTQAA